jgi:citrate lyase subunit beta/citryl-CoA lyase
MALSVDITLARRLGFTGKLCIHPAPPQAVANGFAPSDSELGCARAVLDAGVSVTTINGHMVDKPMLEHARLIFGRAART